MAFGRPWKLILFIFFLSTFAIVLWVWRFFCIEQKQDLERLLNSPQKWLLEEPGNSLHILFVHFCTSFMCLRFIALNKNSIWVKLLNSPQKWLLAFHCGLNPKPIPQILFWCNKGLLQGGGSPDDVALCVVVPRAKFPNI